MGHPVCPCLVNSVGLMFVVLRGGMLLTRSLLWRPLWPNYNKGFNFPPFTNTCFTATVRLKLWEMYELILLIVTLMLMLMILILIFILIFIMILNLDPDPNTTFYPDHDNDPNPDDAGSDYDTDSDYYPDPDSVPDVT